MNDPNSEHHPDRNSDEEVTDPTKSVEHRSVQESNFDHLADEFDPPLEPGSVVERPPEHILNRLRVILWGPHQSVVASILLIFLVLMTAYFSFQWLTKDGLVDIDCADSIRPEFKVDINSAEFGEIVVLPGVGPKLATAVIEYRKSKGGFESVEELCEVPGIGEKTLESLRPFLLPINEPAPNQ